MISFTFWRELVFVILLVGMASVDWKKRVIPDRLLVAAVFNRVAWAVVQNEISIRVPSTLLLSALVPLCLLFLVLALEEWKGCGVMGGGDIKLLFVMALYSDWYQLLLILLAASLLGLLVAFVFRKKGDEALPFAPFLAIGYILIKSGFLSSLFLL